MKEEKMYVKRMNLHKNFNVELQLSSEDWFTMFMKRHLQLSVVQLGRFYDTTTYFKLPPSDGATGQLPSISYHQSAKHLQTSHRRTIRQKLVLPSIGKQKPELSSVGKSKPVLPSFGRQKPVLPSVGMQKPALPSVGNWKPVVPLVCTSKPALPSADQVEIGLTISR